MLKFISIHIIISAIELTFISKVFIPIILNLKDQNMIDELKQQKSSNGKIMAEDRATPDIYESSRMEQRRMMLLN